MGAIGCYYMKHNNMIYTIRIKKCLLVLVLLCETMVLKSQTVTNLVATGTGIKWYAAATGGTALLASNPLVNGTTYFASQTVNGVESSVRMAVTATVVTQAAPTASTHTPSQAQVIWNWNSATGASGYKWNTTNTYGSATDLGNTLTRTETSLTCNTAYTRYVWAYNASGCVSAATTLSQTTSSCVTIPVVTTSTIGSLTSTTAIGGGNVTSNGGGSLTATGVCWSTSSSPTISNSHTSDGTSTGVFVSNLSGMIGNTTYYARAYATNSVGTAYGSEISFTTSNYALWTFSVAGATGETGPTQSAVNSAYSGTSLANEVTINTQGIQEWIVPTSGIYQFQVSGAQGGNYSTVYACDGGYGATLQGDFTLSAGDKLKILVGQQGVSISGHPYGGAGGGGGTFVVNSTASNTLLIAAGGGSGAAGGNYASNGGNNGDNGRVTTQAGPGIARNGSVSASAGGNNGNAGILDTGYGQYEDPGAGYLQSSSQSGLGSTSSAKNFASGGLGQTMSGISYGNGGYGGASGGSERKGGAAGGYSGGGTISSTSGAGDYGVGGGGGSYNGGSNQNNQAGNNSGNGQVKVTKL